MTEQIPDNPPDYQKYYRQMNKVKDARRPSDGLYTLLFLVTWTQVPAFNAPLLDVVREVSPSAPETVAGSWPTAQPRA